MQKTFKLGNLKQTDPGTDKKIITKCIKDKLGVIM
jgi:hypothetical protein